MDIFDFGGDSDDGVRLLKAVLPAVVPACAAPPECGRFLGQGPAQARPAQHAPWITRNKLRLVRFGVG